MPRDFEVPLFYKSDTIAQIKQYRRQLDPKRKNITPTVIDCKTIKFKIARHFGFCFGVENAIDIAYRAVDENKGRRIFLLSEMIHNPQVNADLLSRGVQFLMKTDGTRLIDFSSLSHEDIVIVPAFGTTVELQEELSQIGVNPYYYDTTCPFVEKVWKRAAELGENGFTVVLHGKRTHEETRATFSHSKIQAPTIIILNINDAHFLASYIKGEKTSAEFENYFAGCVSSGFNPQIHLKRVGVVNQTTMLASETQTIADLIRETMRQVYGDKQINEHFADTKDTLCYATYENQSATKALIDAGADLAIVVGGYNSSNTSHLVELAEQKMPTYYIKSADEITDISTIKHFDLHTLKLIQTTPWLPKPKGDSLEIAITSGASCPDQLVEQVIRKIHGFFPTAIPIEQAVLMLFQESFN